MGTTYSNIQVRSDSQEAVAEVLTPLLKEPAYVSPSVGGWVGVYPEGDTDTADKLAKKLSVKLACGVFFWSVYDSDIFFYTLYENGKWRDEFDSNPDYFEAVSPAKKSRLRGKPEVLVQYCLPGVGYSQVQEVLHPTQSPKSGGTALSANALSTVKSLPFLPGKSPETLMEELGKLKQDLAQKFPGKHVFADEQASDLAKLLGIAEDLGDCEFRDIADGHRAAANLSSANREFRLVGNENLPQEYKNEKLWYAVYLEDLQSAVKMGADVNTRDGSGVPPLVKLSRYCAVERMQFLIDNGADVNAATIITDPRHADISLPWNGGEDGITPLMAAAGGSKEHPPYQTEAVQLLLDAGANINARSKTGRTALSEALKMTDPKQHQGNIGRIAPENVLEQAAKQSAKVVEMLRVAGATE